MNQVTVYKHELLDKIKENRDNHRALFEKAIIAYREELKDWFQEQYDLVVEGKNFYTYFDGVEPQDHTKDYDTVIDMLEMSTEDKVNLSNAEFRQYVRDDWGWKGDFIATSSSYIENQAKKAHRR
jgi:hypothetical protein